MKNYNLKKIPKNFLPKVLLIGLEDIIELRSTHVADYEETGLCVVQLKNESYLDDILQQFNPDAIITIGSSYLEFPNLNRQPLDVRRRWKHFDKVTPNLGEIAYQLASHYTLTTDHNQTADIPLISFFTPVHNTGKTLLRTYESVKNQYYNNWEWVIVNDSSDANKTLNIAQSIAKQDCRVKVYDFTEKSGCIGEVKYRAASLCQGVYLMELDHDDYLLPEAAYLMVETFKAHSDCKFVYSDYAEIFENHNSIVYSEGSSFGYGSYKEERFGDHVYQVANTPNINPKTIRHIVGVPNHFRAWDKTFYHSIGGHNRRLSIADDYELLVRTFLKTKMVRIPKLLYLQYYHQANTQNIRRADIARRVRTISQYYNERIHARFIELGVRDWAYDFNPSNPLLCPSQFGAEEQAVNEIMTFSDGSGH